MLNKITKFLKKYQIPLIMGVLMLTLPELVGAQVFGNEVDQKIAELFSVLNVVIQFLLVLLWPVLLLIGGLMSNDLLFSGGMQTTLLNVWSGVRDFVNVMFILGLLGIAIVNILGVANEEFQIKSVLPRIVVALIVVNFSFLGCKVVLDISNVISTSIFSLPLTETIISDPVPGDQTASSQNGFVQKICGNLYRLQGSQQETSGGDTPAVSDQQFSQFCSGSDGSFEFTPSAQQFFGSFNSKNVALIMAMQLMDIGSIDQVNGQAVKGLKSLTINTLFSVVFIIIYATAFIALFVGLLVRVVVLWVIIVISPLIALGWAIKPIGERLKVDGEDLMAVFIQHATMTIPVAVVLTIGTIMISAVKKVAPGAVLSTNPAELGAIISGTTTIQDIIAGVGTAAFIWLAVAQTVTKGKGGAFAQTILGAVGDGAKAIAKVPLYLPLIPVKTASGATPTVGLAALGGALGAPQRLIQDKQREINDIFNNREGQVSDNLKRATNPNQLKETIAIAAAQDIARKSDFQKQLADKLTKEPALAREFQNMKFTVKGQNVQYAQFVEALKKGELERQDFDYLVKQNNFPNPQSQLTVNKGNDAGKALNSAAQPLGVDKLAPVQSRKDQLEKKVKDLADKKGGVKDSDVTDLTASINKLTTSLEAINKMQLTNGVVPSADQQRELSKYIKSSGLNEIEGAQVLTQIFEKKGIPGADNLAKSIVKGDILSPALSPGQTPAQPNATSPNGNPPGTPPTQPNPNPTDEDFNTPN
ncbi:MAG: hypothetical protein ACRCZE_02340 [Candidatus Altimarinota bacterium]